MTSIIDTRATYISLVNRFWAVLAHPPIRQVRQGKGPDAREFSVTVSVGIVSEMLETILYARVRMPARCQVWDDAFARTVGALQPDWNLGIRVDIACALVREFVDDG